MNRIMKCVVISIFSMLLTSAAASASDCPWTDRDCVADDIDDTVEGTWIEPIVEPITDEIRDSGDDDEPSSLDK